MYFQGFGLTVSALAAVSSIGGTAAGPITSSEVTLFVPLSTGISSSIGHILSNAPSPTALVKVPHASPKVVSLAASQQKKHAISQRSLVPFRPRHKDGFIEPQPNFNPTKSQNFQWATSRDASIGLAQLDIFTASNTQRYLSDEQFSPAIKSVTCHKTGVSITLNSAKNYELAKSHWSWVNKPGNKLFLFLDQHGCGDDEARQPYSVTKATFLENNSLEFAAVEAQWTHVVEGYNFQYGSSPSRKRSDVQPREIGEFSKNLGPYFIDFNHDISHSIISPKDIGDGVTLELDCQPCSTSGEIQVQILASLESAQLTFSTPQQLGASITLQLAAQAALTNSIDKTFALPDINLADLPSIEGLFEAGPVLHVQAQADISQIEAEVALSAGVDVTIDPSSQLEFDVFNPDSHSIRGWTPSFKPQTPSVSGNVSVTANVVTELVLDLEATVAGKGFAVGVALAAPEIDARLSAAADTAGGVCSDSHAVAGVSVDLGAGAELDFFAGKKTSNLDIQDLPHKVQILTTSTDIFSTCLVLETGVSLPPTNCPGPDGASITVNCQENIPQQTAAPFQGDIAQNLAGVLRQQIDHFCVAQFDGSGDATHVTFGIGGELIELHRTSNGGCLTHCHDALNFILDTCIIGSLDYGGIANVGDEWYNITNSEVPANPMVIPVPNGPPFTITPVPLGPVKHTPTSTPTASPKV